MSSLASSTRRTAGKAGNSTLLHGIARGGFVGFGLLHLAIAWLAVRIALGRPAGESDQSGALRVLVREPLGRPLVWIIVVGLAGMALWQLLAAATGYRDERGNRKILERLGSLGRAVIYAALAWDGARVAVGSPTSSAGQQRQTTAGVLAHSSGRVLVALAGVVVLGAGIGMIVFGVKRAFLRHLNTGQMGPGTRRSATVLGVAGYAAKGTGYGIVGVLLFTAAVHRDPKRSGGLDEALRTLAGQPFGRVLLIVTAAGFAAFGAYCFVQSRYRDV
jgi:hypothetical protein